jgi:glycosyltransferase involved in cell wall biosynthesis
VAYFISLDSIHCKKWIRHLSKSQKSIIITYEGMSIPENELPGVKIYNLFPRTFPVKNFIARWLTIRRIRKVFKQNNVTLIHSMYCYPNSVWANYFKRYKKIITTRGSDVLIDYKGILQTDNKSLIYLRQKLEQAFKDAVFITSTSNQQKEYLVSKNVPATKISVIRTGIEPEHFSIKENNHNDGIFRILSPRSVQPNYNVHNMLLALKHILNTQPGIKIRFDQVMFNANPDYLKLIYRSIDELSLKEHLNFIPPYDLSSVSDIYAQYDLAIMVPKSDGTPVSALEVMINKKPLLISKLPYDADVINEDICWMVDHSSPEEIAAGILTIMKTSKEELNKKMDRAYENVLQHLNTHNEMKKVLQLYKAI